MMNRTVRLGAALLTALLGADAARGGAAEELLARAREAIGSGVPMPAGKVFELRGTTALLGLDSALTVLIGPAFEVRVSADGPVRFERCWAGAGSWRRDLGGEVTPMYFGEHDEFAASAAIVSGRWTVPGAFEVTLDPALQDAGAPYVLGFKDPNGRISGTMKLDRASLRPVWASYQTGAERESVTLEGGMEVGGRWFPSAISIAGGRGDATRYEFAAASLVDAAGDTFVMNAGAPADTAYDTSKPAVLDVKKTKSGHILVRPSINGADAGWWIFDTGAGGGVIDSAAADRLGLKSFGEIPVSGLGGSMMSSLVRPDEFSLGPVSYRGVYMTKLDLGGIAKAMGEEIAGVVGYSLMHRCIVKLDMHTPHVELLDGATFDGGGLAWQKMWVYERHPAVEAVLEGAGGIYKLDSGAGQQAVFMHTWAVNDMRLLERPTTDSKAGGVGGSKPIKVGTLAEFALAGKTYKDLKASFSLAADGPTADRYTVGTIGGAILRDFDLVLDYRGERIAFLERK